MTTANASVNLWGSKPGENDDCWTGIDCISLDAARAFYEDPFGGCGFSESYNTGEDELWIELKCEAEGIYEARCIWKGRPAVQERVRMTEDSEWKREIAMQAGMEFGVDGYNDAMGW